MPKTHAIGVEKVKLNSSGVPKHKAGGLKGDLLVAWMVLIGAGVMEAVWAISLERSQGFSHMVPTIVFAIALALSMIGLSFALKSLPLGTAYAVWVGIGAALTVIYGMVFGGDSVNFAKIALIVVLISCVVGLKLVGDIEGA